jgi:hypothetical protein
VEARLEWRATGGHPDKGEPDPIFQEALDAIILRNARVTALEAELREARAK